MNTYLTCGPPTASSRCLHCFVVLESIHTGELTTEKQDANCMCKNPVGFKVCSVFSAPFVQ